ncbi:Gp49 family protein [Moraxella bovis]|uniref:Gp49 family protein n=1 Tax=Moraxella bovis TaxID=476 RepID=UPI00222656C4|nr:Gp49 family protein [Moraxella bovis]UZA56239.1 hypothetical protein LP127_09055 [Moraxella bovis]
MKSITKEFLESEIVNVQYTRLTGTLTHCAITVKSGFTFTGESACVDEASFNQELGEKYAYEQAFEKMWLPYGFWLKQKLFEKAQNLRQSTSKPIRLIQSALKTAGQSKPRQVCIRTLITAQWQEWSKHEQRNN